MKLKKGSPLERIYNGVWRENPTFVLMLRIANSFALPSMRNALSMQRNTSKTGTVARMGLE